MQTLYALENGTRALRLEALSRTALVRVVAGPSAVLGPNEARELGTALLSWAKDPAAVEPDPAQLRLM
jgi:hypothetical protein